MVAKEAFTRSDRGAGTACLVTNPAFEPLCRHPETDEIQPPYLGYGTVRIGMDIHSQMWYEPIIYPKFKYGVAAKSYTTKGENITITITAESQLRI